MGLVISAIARDVRAAMRQFRAAPAYALSVIATLAIAIGANSAIFGAVHAVLLRPSPIAEPDRTVLVHQTDNISGQSVIELTYRHLREWQAASSTFTHAALVATHNWHAVLGGRGDPARLSFAGVSAGFFDALGVQPVLGRDFETDDDVPAAEPVAILNHGTWMRRFGGNPSIVGATLRLDGESVRVVGVMPPGVDFPREAEFWRPAAPILTGGGATPNLSALDMVGVFYVIGRLRSGLDAAAASREIDDTERRLDAAQPGRARWGDRAVVRTFRDHVFGAVRPALWALWAAVGVLLLVACTNVSGLLLTRVALRRREQSLRLALGASRAQVVRLWLIEIAVLTGAGGVLGLIAARLLASAIAAVAPANVPHLADVAVDRTVVAFTSVVVGLTVLLCGLMPTRQARRTGLIDAMGDGTRGVTERHSDRLRSGLLIAQMAMAVTLLVAAGLVVRSVERLRAIDLGFSPANVLALTVEPRVTQPPPNEFVRQLIERVEALPNVEAAGAIFLRPLALGPIGAGVRVVLEGQPETAEAAARNPTLNYQAASPGYFGTMRIPLRHGRLFTARDTGETSRVAIVSESAARLVWPGQDPLGKRVFMAAFSPGQKAQWRTVVGVVGDVRYRGIDEVQPDIYDPALQVGQPANTILVRAESNPMALAGAITARARKMDPSVAVYDITTMDAVVAQATAPWRMSMWLFVHFAGVAFFLAAVGLASVVSLDVAHRRREIAVRLALGATAGAVLRGVLASAAWKVAIGVIAGLVIPVAATRAMAALLFGVGPLDGVTYAAVVVLVGVVVAVAAYAPASRAARIDPITLMRAEW